MLPWETIERAKSPDGSELTLVRRGDEWVVRVAGKTLMSSRMHGSEDSLATEAINRVKNCQVVLVGGMGLGYTLRAALDRVGPKAKVVVCELLPELIEWNRKHVGFLAKNPLEDPRVQVRVQDVGECIKGADSEFDAMLLDVDNGPSAVVDQVNHGLYTDKGIAACARALRPKGILAVWSAAPSPSYAKRLRSGQLEAEVISARAHSSGRGEHVIFLGKRRA